MMNSNGNINLTENASLVDCGRPRRFLDLKASLQFTYLNSDGLTLDKLSACEAD